ncbi:ATP-dependent DNA helicase Q-like 5 isoform X5 [Camellia sinensis]|uniref:ATP-dependent DNA helicase Q-like 5 isoform X5 n=1 Tax=Camellia sinensis TaxID=4442 RepID=UPI0010355507|nr:ATP-dependent DNA helicase Q-like 5 isoform X5 [Camellia sinensis]
MAGKLMPWKTHTSSFDFSLPFSSSSSMDPDSDSDSDGSHISSTPPRHLPSPPPPPPPPPQLPPRPPTLRSSNKSKIKLKPTISHQKPISKPKPKPPSNSNPKKPFQSDPSPIPIPSPDLSDLPFQIRRPSDENQVISAENSINNVQAGGLFLSKFASFSKIRRPTLNLESIEIDTPKPPQAEIEAIGAGNLDKVLKRHPNLIGGSNVHTVPVKKLKKCSNEGNFVRLNINGYGSKYKSKFKSKFKGKRKSYYVSSGGRSFRGSKRKSKNGGEVENEGFCEEDGLDTQQVGKRPRFEINEELLEEAVMGVRNEASNENLLKLLKLTHGYESFRDGQLEAIKMVLSGKSTMLVLPTGAGKSLCYQLPALVLPGITIVVSPLVALMIDQLKQLPSMIEGSLLCSTQTPEEMFETLRMIQEGTIKVLFVSPERFLNAEFISIFSATPLISLLVVDEAHCVSEWSHNFRPSYMRLRASLLRDMLNVQCILAMTATATTKTLNDVMCALEISPTNLIKASHLRDNLQLSVTLSRNRMKDLMMLIKSSPFAEVQSIIIYCKFQYETDLISKYLSDNNIQAMWYTLKGSKSYSGIILFQQDKSGYPLHFTRKLGRVCSGDRTCWTRCDGVDEYAVSRFLSEVFTNELDSHGKVCSLVKEPASRKFDMKEEVMLTILTHLELGEVQYLRLLPQTNVTCTINFHQTTPALLAAKDIVIAAILKKSDIKHGQYVFDIPTVANIIGVSSIDILNQLQKLKSKGEITYEMKDPAYCYTIVDVPKDFCSLTAHLTKWLSEVESCKVQKMDAMFNAAAFAVQLCKKINGCNDSQHTPCLQKKILEYFNGYDDSDVPNKMDQSSRFLRADIKVFLQSNSQAKFTPRAVARIMHGIASPAYPSATWSKTHFWGRYTQTNFQVIMEAAKAELMNFVTKDVI